MTTRDIQAYLEEAYGVEVSPTFISQVTNAVMMVLYLALHQASKRWTMPIRNWKTAMAQFEIMYQDRI